MNDNPLPPTSGVLAKYAGDNREAPDIRQHGCYSAHATDLRMLDVRLADGTHVGLPYHYLNEIRYTASERFTLEFATCRITVDGLRLDPIYQALLFNRVGYLSVSDAAPTASFAESVYSGGGGEARIRAISVTALDEA